MPEVGVSSSLASAAPVAKAHTATQQWQSFEIRMRHRRAERCRLRAEVAIDAGFFDDAREALDEARRLQPDLPELAQAEARLAAAQLAQQDAAEGSPRSVGRRFAAAASIALAVGAGSWVMVGNQDGTGPWRPPATVASPAVVPVSETTVPLTDQTASATADVEPEPTPADDPATRVQVSPEPPLTPDAPASAVAPGPAVVAPPAEPPSAWRDADTTLLPVLQVSTLAPSSQTPVPPPTTSLPTEAPPPPAVGTSGVSRPEPGPVAEPAADEQVRAALARYAAGYSTLNAAAVRAVWPSVDAGGLARAFDSLESQRIALASCSIVLAADGVSARATCAGTATWTPKVGGGATTESRNWQFALARDGSAWQIVSATVR